MQVVLVDWHLGTNSLRPTSMICHSCQCGVSTKKGLTEARRTTVVASVPTDREQFHAKENHRCELHGPGNTDGRFWPLQPWFYTELVPLRRSSTSTVSTTIRCHLSSRPHGPTLLSNLGSRATRLRQLSKVLQHKYRLRALHLRRQPSRTMAWLHQLNSQPSSRPWHTTR